MIGFPTVFSVKQLARVMKILMGDVLLAACFRPQKRFYRGKDQISAMMSESKQTFYVLLSWYADVRIAIEVFRQVL
jgi:hypothetical protein